MIAYLGTACVYLGTLGTCLEMALTIWGQR